MPPTAVGIIGAGNVGQAMAAHLSSLGVEVKLYSKWEDELKPLQRAGGIYMQGCAEGLSKPAVLTTSLATALNGSDLVIVAVPAFAHFDVSRDIAKLIHTGQTVLFHPGTLGTSFQFIRELDNSGRHDISLGVTQTSLYACRIVEPARVNLRDIKRGVSVAAMPATATAGLIDLLNDVFGPDRFVASDNVVGVELGNINPVYHCPPTLFNFGRVEAGEQHPFFEYTTECVANVVDALDQERIAVASAMGMDASSFWSFLRSAYSREKADRVELVHAAYGHGGASRAPDSTGHRYVTEDVPFGLVPWSSMATQLGVPTPVCNSIITLYSTLYGRDFQDAGRTMRSIGVDRLSAKEIRALVCA